MSIVIHFTARTESVEKLKNVVRHQAGVRDYKVYEEEDSLTIRLCPMGDMIMKWETAKEDVNSGWWLVTGESYSTPAGAGMHKGAVDLLDVLAADVFEELKVDDPSGYYEHRDFEQMKREHFYPWLNSLVNICSVQFNPEECNNICFCWDVDQYVPEDIHGTVVSPMGRFSVPGLEENVRRQGIAWFADRFFVWDQQEKDGRYYRNTAMNLLWEHCYFAPSHRSREDREYNEEILDALETAARMDPALPLPLEAYREICALDGREPASFPGTPEFESEFPIGFKKGLVTYPYGNLRLTLPGRYLYQWGEYEEGGGCDCWWDSSSHSPTWRMNHYRKREGDAALTDHAFNGKDPEHRTMKNGKACWGWSEEEEDGEPFYMVTCEAVSGPSLFVITVSYEDPQDRDEIYELLRKMEMIEEQSVEELTESYDRRQDGGCVRSS